MALGSGKDGHKKVFNIQISHRPNSLTGEVTVMHNETRAVSKVDFFLDTESETSFIYSSLAKRLHLHLLELSDSISSDRKKSYKTSVLYPDWKAGMKKELY